jgi:hypothetical protein
MREDRALADRRRDQGVGVIMEPREQRLPIYELEIDELVLEGFEPGERHAIAAAMERELTRLLSAGDAPLGAVRADGLSVESLDAGVFSLAVEARASAVGVAAARAVNRSLGTLTVETASIGTAPSAGPIAGTPLRGSRGPKP